MFILFLFSLHALLTDSCMPPKAENCTSLGVLHKDRCIVCRNPKDRATLSKWGKRCLTAKARAEQLAPLPVEYACNACEEQTAACSCCSPTFMGAAAQALSASQGCGMDDVLGGM